MPSRNAEQFTFETGEVGEDHIFRAERARQVGEAGAYRDHLRASLVEDLSQDVRQLPPVGVVPLFSGVEQRVGALDLLLRQPTAERRPTSKGEEGTGVECGHAPSSSAGLSTGMHRRA